MCRAGIYIFLQSCNQFQGCFALGWAAPFQLSVHGRSRLIMRVSRYLVAVMPSATNNNTLRAACLPLPAWSLLPAPDSICLSPLGSTVARPLCLLLASLDLPLQACELPGTVSRLLSLQSSPSVVCSVGSPAAHNINACKLVLISSNT